MVEINKTITLKLIFLISIIALASAFFIEYILGHQPCNLCILERIPYLLALIIIVLNYYKNIKKFQINKNLHGRIKSKYSIYNLKLNKHFLK